MALILERLANTGVPLEIRQQALDRALADPGIPNPMASTKSFWMNTPHATLAKMQSKAFPQEAEIVIIGSGITGASVAKTILEHKSNTVNGLATRPKVVLLEARDICSGATGRNGGHILESAEEFAVYEEAFGSEAAKKLIRFKLSHLDEMLKIADELDITSDCQARRVQFITAVFEEEAWDHAAEQFERLKTALPEETKHWVALKQSEIPRDLCMPHARGLIYGTAGALWPYKFVTAVFDKLKAKYCDSFQIETNTPVNAISENAGEDSSLRFSVNTSRGTVRAQHIIHCTNAHIGHLVPGLRGNIFPLRGQMSAQSPGEKFPHQGNDRSWIFVYDSGFDYLTQLPHDEHSAGEMMFGGGFAQSAHNGLSDLGIATDDKMSLNADIHLSGAMGAVFGRENWGSGEGSGVKQMWTGNMGFSADGLPWVGRLPSSLTDRGTPEQDKAQAEKGQEWASAAYSGEGMVQAWLCGKAVASMLLRHDNGGQWPEEEEPTWFPEQMLITEERVKCARLPSQIDV